MKSVIIHKLLLDGRRNIKACWKIREDFTKELRHRWTRMKGNIKNRDRLYRDGMIRSHLLFHSQILYNIRCVHNKKKKPGSCKNKTFSIWPLWKSCVWNNGQIYCKNKENTFWKKMWGFSGHLSPPHFTPRWARQLSRGGNDISWPPAHDANTTSTLNGGQLTSITRISNSPASSVWGFLLCFVSEARK